MARATTQDHWLQHRHLCTHLYKSCIRKDKHPSSDLARPLPATTDRIITAPHITRPQTWTTNPSHPSRLPKAELSHLPHPPGRASTAPATMEALHLRLQTTRLSPLTHLLTTTTEMPRTPQASATPPASAQPHARTSQAKRCSTQPALRPDALHRARTGNAHSKTKVTMISTRTTSSPAVAAANPKRKLKKPTTAMVSVPTCRSTATRTTSSHRRHLRLLLLHHQARQRSRSDLAVFVSKTRARAKAEMVMAGSREPRGRKISSGLRLTRRLLIFS
jgi:hypothetical protein